MESIIKTSVKKIDILILFLVQNKKSLLIIRSALQLLAENDLQTDVYKRAVILLCLSHLIYVEELIDGTAGTDNPIFSDA